MGDDPRDGVMRAHARWYAALQAMFDGDPEPFRAVYSARADATYMPAEGGLLTGFEAAYADWRRQADRSLGATVEVIEVHAVVEGDMAGTQTVIAVTIAGPDGEPHRVRARETSVYRRESGEWRVVMHQADDIRAWRDVMEAR